VLSGIDAITLLRESDKTGANECACNECARRWLAAGKECTLFLTFENPDDVRMRFIIAAYALNLTRDEIGAAIMVLDARAKPEEVLQELISLAEAEPFSLIIVDTFAAFFDGDDTNDAKQGGEFMRRLRPLTKLKGKPAVLVAAHPVKNAAEDNLLPYGSGAVLNESTEISRFGKIQEPELSPCIGKANCAGLISGRSTSASIA